MVKSGNVLKMALDRRCIASVRSPLSCRSRPQRVTRKPLANRQSYVKESPIASPVKNNEAEELRTLYAKLRDIIPSSKCSRTSDPNLDVVLGAVGYIKELHAMIQQKLESEEASGTRTTESDIETSSST